jgi:hypothetical protein
MKPERARNRYFRSLLAALASASSAGIALADTTNQIAITTFDSDAPAGWGFYYFYGDNGLGIASNPDRFYYLPDDVDLTNAMCRYSFDNTDLAGNENYGTGFGAPLNYGGDPTVFVSTNREDYIFSFDARVEGLLPDQATANMEMQVQIFNSSATPTKILQVNLPFDAGSNMTHFEFLLSDGSLGDNTTDAGFAAGYQGVTTLQFGLNRHAPNGVFGTDGDNAIVLDNLKLSVIQKPVVVYPPPTVPVAVFDWNLDDKPIYYTYGGYSWTESGTPPTFNFPTNIAVDGVGFGVDGSVGWFLTMDNSALAATPPAWAGGGTGGGGPVDFSRFDTGDLTAYRISFAAKALGLAQDVPQTTCSLQLFLDSPNGNLRLDFAVTAGTNWVTNSFTLNQGSAGSGTKPSFTTNYNTYTALRTQWQIENVTSPDWGYDADNALVLDNIKLVRNYIACPPLTITPNANTTVITWAAPATGSTKLLSAPDVGGPWTEVIGANSGYVVPGKSGTTFFRTLWVAPGP